jgi:integrase
MERGENRRGKKCSPRSIRTVRGSVELHLADYLDRPLVDLTADVIEEVMNRIEEEAERVGGSNPNNPPGRAAANRIIANVSAIWRSWHKRHGLPVSNPTERLLQRALAPRDNRIDNAELPDWYAKVQAMENAVRRDLQLVALFTGVRSDGVRSLRWDDVDFDDGLIQIARAKGDRPYTLPMVQTVRDILERRQADNPALMDPFGGDHGYVFPSIARDGETVQAVAEVKERITKRDAKGRTVRDEDGNAIREQYLPGVQACRKTFNSVAIEIGVPQEARESLMNHSGRGVNVRSYGFPQNWDYLRECATKIEVALWSRIKGEHATAKGRKRR